MITAGPRNRAGPKGDQGPRGLQGETGLPGVDGSSPEYQWRGTEIRFKKPSGSWGPWVDLKGKDGRAGGPGAPGASGADGTNGRDGVITSLCSLALFTAGLVDALLANQHNDVLTDAFGFALGKEFGMLPATCMDEYNSGLSDSNGQWLFADGEMLI